MINQTVADLEAALNALDKIDARKKAELLGLLTTLKGELSELEGKHAALRLSVGNLEATHPQLVEAVNELCGFLAKLGI